MTHNEAKKAKAVKEAYREGFDARKEGRPEKNPYGKTDLLRLCAWSGGYWDAKMLE